MVHPNVKQSTQIPERSLPAAGKLRSLRKITQGRQDDGRWVLSGGDGGAMQAILQRVVLAANLRRQAVAEYFEEFRGGIGFFRPITRIHAQQFVYHVARNRHSIQGKRSRRRNVTDRRIRRRGPA